MRILEGLKLENPCLFRARLSSRFADERDYGCHGGIDLTYRNKHDGLYLRPALPGWVDYAGEDKKTGLGLYVRMRHEWAGLLLFTWYCHLDAIYLPSGEFWETQVMLGIAGATGNVVPAGPQGRHLHFALQVPFHGRSGCGIPSVVDPLPFFPADVVTDWTK